MKHARHFDCQPESVADARHFVRDVLSDQPREIAEAAELMTSELATNSVRHARSDFELAIRLSREEIRVEVSDRGQGQPIPRSPTPREQSGRGLQIVQALCRDWGSNPSPNGKLVWFTLPLRRPAGEHESRLTESTGETSEQGHQPERSDGADPGSSRPSIANLCWPQPTLKVYAEPCGARSVISGHAERRRGLARESARV
jgi:anti-sigma regulatory factor (Ser/Thr protein kinase)